MVEGWVYLSFSSLYPAQTATVYQHDLFKAAVRAIPFYIAFIVALPIAGFCKHSRVSCDTPLS